MNKVITYKSKSLDIKTMKPPTHCITSIYIDNFNNFVSVIIQKGLEINSVKITMEKAQEMGFINFNALKDYCK